MGLHVTEGESSGQDCNKSEQAELGWNHGKTWKNMESLLHLSIFKQLYLRAPETFFS